MTFNEFIKDFVSRIMEKDSDPALVNGWLMFALLKDTTIPSETPQELIYDTCRQIMWEYYNNLDKKGEFKEDD